MPRRRIDKEKLQEKENYVRREVFVSVFSLKLKNYLAWMSFFGSFFGQAKNE